MRIPEKINNLYKIFLKHRDNTENCKDTELFTEIFEKMERTRKMFMNAELKIGEIEREMELLENNGENITVVWENNGIKAILAENVKKPHISEITKFVESCNCMMEIDRQQFSLDIKSLNFINTEEDLQQLEKNVSTCVIEVFSHSYRTYKPFICWMGILTMEEDIFIVDVLKHKEALAKSSFFRCGIQKIFHCENCAKLVLEEFGDIGCFVNFSCVNETEYVDWRIRPINHLMTDIIVKSLLSTAEKVKDNASVERYSKNEDDEENAVEKFKENNYVRKNLPLLESFLAARHFLAKEYGESEEYVLPDEQLITLLETNVQNGNDVDMCLPRMSSTLRKYVTDFLILIRNKNKNKFDLETFKDKTNIDVDDYEEPSESTRYKKFDKTFSADSTFEISDIEK